MQSYEGVVGRKHYSEPLLVVIELKPEEVLASGCNGFPTCQNEHGSNGCS